MQPLAAVMPYQHRCPQDCSESWPCNHPRKRNSSITGCHSTSEKKAGDSICPSVIGWRGIHNHRPTQYPTPANIAAWNRISRYTGVHPVRPRVYATVLMCLPTAACPCHAAALSSRPLRGQGSLRCPKTDEDNADTDDTSRHPAAETHGLVEQHFRHNNDEDIAQADRWIC